MKLLALWAARDLLRRPFEALLAAIALGAFVATAGTALLLTTAVERTALALVDAGPSVIVRRLGPSGFVPMPATATASVAGIPGALEPRLRTWGPVRAGSQAVEIFAVDERSQATLQSLDLPALGAQEVVVGPGLAHRVRAYLSIDGPGTSTVVRVVGALPPRAGVSAQDTLLAPPGLARELLGLPEGHGTDLAFDVFRESEEDAIKPDIAQALPFPVVIETRHDARGRYEAALARRGSLFTILLLPALFALVALVAQVARERAARRREVGLLKAIGWTSGDIVRMHLLRAGLVGGPAVAVGAALAWIAVFAGASWPGALLLGWADAPPRLALDVGGGGLVLAEVVVVALAPWLVATLWPTIVGSARDPYSLLSEGDP